jgi:hypothetical protein
MQAHAEDHLALRWEHRITRSYGALDGDGTLHCLHRAGKLSQQIITRVIHHPPPILPNERGHEAAIGRQGTDSGCLILVHESAVALDISTENGRKPAFQAHRADVTGRRANDAVGHAGPPCRSEIIGLKRLSITHREQKLYCSFVQSSRLFIEDFYANKTFKNKEKKIVNSDRAWCLITHFRRALRTTLSSGPSGCRAPRGYSDEMKAWQVFQKRR